jgi:hypothetical protein
MGGYEIGAPDMMIDGRVGRGGGNRLRGLGGDGRVAGSEKDGRVNTGRKEVVEGI